MKKKEHSISKKKLRSSYATSIISISLVLFLLGLVGLLVLNANRLAIHIKENIGFSVILKEQAKEVDIIRLQKNLDAKTYVKSTDYITREEAARQTMEDLGEDFINFLGDNPLPPIRTASWQLNRNYSALMRCRRLCIRNPSSILSMRT